MKRITVKAKKELADARQRIGSQREFVGILKLYIPNLTQPTYNKWESGQRGIRIDHARKIALFLDQPLDKIFERK